MLLKLRSYGGLGQPKSRRFRGRMSPIVPVLGKTGSQYLAYANNANYDNVIGYVHIGTIATITPATEVPAFARALITDYGYPFLELVAVSGVWVPVGEQRMAHNTASASGSTGSAEQALAQVLFPVGLLSANGRYFKILAGVGKSAGAETGTLRLRFGTAGNLTDTVIAQGTFTTQSQVINTGFMRASTTSVLQLGDGNQLISFSSTAGGGGLRTVTGLSSMASNAMYLTLSISKSASSETPTIQNFDVVIG